MDEQAFICDVCKYSSDQEYEFNFVRSAGDMGSYWICEDCSEAAFFSEDVVSPNEIFFN